MEASRTDHLRLKYEHCESAMSKMWDLQSKELFCDVAIKVDGKVFHCHRTVLSATSEYFLTMFTSNFKESSATEITLHGVNVESFEAILQFIYTGNVDINTSNAVGLIHAVDFYGLALLEGHLIEFVKKTCPTLPSEDTLKMFASAHVQGLKSLFSFLGEHIYGDFGFFSDSAEFINLTWNSLMELPCLASIADKFVLTDTFVEGILKWIRSQPNATVDERCCYFEQFVDLLWRTKSATTCILHILERYKNAKDAPGTNAVAVLGERPPKLLRAFVRESGPDNVASIFTLHETNAGLAWAYSGKLESSINSYMRNVVIDDTLYTMIPNSLDPPAYTSFSLHRRAFTGAPHISWNQCQSLKRPPGIALRTEMCAMNNHIFVSNDDLESGSAEIDDDYPEFINENRNYRVILYKRDIDKWFPLPSPHNSSLSGMTCDDRMVYLIGGVYSNGIVQAYDPRTRDWMNLPPTTGIYVAPASCIRDGKIWVVGGLQNPLSVEIFDPVAGTWERGQDLTESRNTFSQLVNWDSVHYGRTVVSFCTDDDDTDDDDDHVILFSDNSKSTGWNTIPDLKPQFRNVSVTESNYNNKILSMVVF